MLRRPRHPGLAWTPAGWPPPGRCSRSCWSTPTEELVGRRDVLGAAVAALPAPVREPVCRFLTVLDTVPLGRLQRDYVETFDVTRRCCLYLTYFAHGDTRKRGLALVQFKQAYRKAGVEFDAAELPDHLCVVLEFGAAHDPTPPGGCSTTTAPASRCCGSPWRRRAPRGTTCSSPWRPRCPSSRARTRRR